MCRCVLQVLSAGSAAQAPDLEGREHAKKRFRAANLAHLHRLLYQVKANTKLERAVLSTNAQEQPSWKGTKSEEGLQGCAQNGAEALF